MRKILTILTIVLFILFMVSCENSVNPINSDSQNLSLAKSDGEPISLAKKDKCATIQGETILYSTGHYLAGEPLEVGFDIYGYNYQGKMFKGSYANTYLGGDGFPPYLGDTDAYIAANPTIDDLDSDGYNIYWYWPHRDVHLAMKWNDAWLSNKDCDGDHKLDRHYGHDSYIGSGAWITNHQSGDNWCGGEKGWNYFVKIVAAPADAYKEGGYWYNVDGEEIGPVIWTSFAIIQQVDNDPCLGTNGLLYKSPVRAGVGNW